MAPEQGLCFLQRLLFRVGVALAISIPRTEAAVIRHFQERVPYILFVPDVS
jgi:hypothetical protein